MIGSRGKYGERYRMVSVIVPDPRPGRMVMVETGPGPLGLCPVRGVTEVELRYKRIK